VLAQYEYYFTPTPLILCAIALNTKHQRSKQARNQLGTPGGVKSFPRGAHIFSTMSNIFKLYPTHFPGGGLCPHAPPWLRAWLQVRISEENKLNATTQQLITAKISGCVSNQGVKHTNHCVRAIYNGKMRLR